MGLFARLLGRQPKKVDRDPGVSRLQEMSRERTRRELISMAVRDTLKRHRFADGCITSEALPGFTSAKHRGMHVQLVFRDGQPNMLGYVVALETAMRARLARLDPLSPSWIAGFSWRFEPADRTGWPQLPVPGRADAGAVRSGRAERPAPANALQELLRSGDEAFLPAGRAQRRRATDFSPTLPMPH
jgi:hypothetical protein